MKENYKRLLNKSEEFTMEDECNIYFLFKHKFFARWLAFKLMYRTFQLEFIVGITTILSIGCIKMKIIPLAIISGIVALITLILFIFVVKIDFKVLETEEEIDLKTEKIQNLWLLNRKVISRKDWRKIKKQSKENYEKLRSEKVNGKSFSATYYIANAIQNEDIRIIWFVYYSNIDDSWKGQAVLEKHGVLDDYVYDPNLRRTYYKEQYMEVIKAQVYKKFIFDEYNHKVDSVPSDQVFWDLSEYVKEYEKFYEKIIKSE